MDDKPTIFAYDGPSPGGNVHWAHRAYDEPATAYLRPDGSRGSVVPHRLYRMPSGVVSTNPHVAQLQTRSVRKWLPATTELDRPAGVRGAWVQLSITHPTVGMMHSPGLKSRPVKVLDVQGGKALVRHRLSRPGHTPRRRNVGSRVGADTKESWYCRLFPWAARCRPVAGARTNPAGGHMVTMHDMAVGNTPAQDRYKASGGGALADLGKTIQEITAGKSRIVINRQGLEVETNR